MQDPMRLLAYNMRKQQEQEPPSNLDQFTPETFNQKMNDIESHYLKDNQGKDLGAKLKVASSAFNKQLGEITDYVFKTVGKELNKNIDEFSNKITKI